MKDFEVIYKKGEFWGNHLKCNHCGERVEKGIAAVSHHWVHCLKRTEGLIIVKQPIKK